MINFPVGSTGPNTFAEAVARRQLLDAAAVAASPQQKAAAGGLTSMPMQQAEQGKQVPRATLQQPQQKKQAFASGGVAVGASARAPGRARVGGGSRALGYDVRMDAVFNAAQQKLAARIRDVTPGRKLCMLRFGCVPCVAGVLWCCMACLVGGLRPRLKSAPCTADVASGERDGVVKQRAPRSRRCRSGSVSDNESPTKARKGGMKTCTCS